MNSRQALKTAEILWDDTMTTGSFLDQMMQLAPTLEELRLAGKSDLIRQNITEMKSEVVARWANIILEMEDHEQNELYRA